MLGFVATFHSEGLEAVFEFSGEILYRNMLGKGHH